MPNTEYTVSNELVANTSRFKKEINQAINLLKDMMLSLKVLMISN